MCTGEVLVCSAAARTLGCGARRYRSPWLPKIVVALDYHDDFAIYHSATRHLAECKRLSNYHLFKRAIGAFDRASFSGPRRIYSLISSLFVRASATFWL